MMEDGVIPSQRKIKSFLGMVQYYQQFIQKRSNIAKPLFVLVTAVRVRKVPGRGVTAFRKLNPGDWKEEHTKTFQQLKAVLMDSVTLVHQDFNRGGQCFKQKIFHTWPHQSEVVE